MISKKIDHAFIMAAGRGTRLMPLTKKIPKGLIKYKQSSLISNGIDKLRKYINFIHISVGYKGPILAKHLIEQKVSSIVNTDNKGNAWWIFNSIFKYFDRPIYVLTCDNVTDINFKKIEKDYYRKKKPLCMIIPTKPVVGLSGDYISSKNNVINHFWDKLVYNGNNLQASNFVINNILKNLGNVDNVSWGPNDDGSKYIFEIKNENTWEKDKTEDESA